MCASVAEVLVAAPSTCLTQVHTTSSSMLNSI